MIFNFKANAEHARIAPSAYSVVTSAALTPAAAYSSLDPRDCGKIEAKKQSMDEMTELIYLQKSNGVFEISSENWIGSVYEEYLGSYFDVKSSCPTGIYINLWITALSMKIFEVKMEDKKDLWDLVMQKSHKFLNAKLNNINENYENLMNQAEKFVKAK